MLPASHVVSASSPAYLKAFIHPGKTVAYKLQTNSGAGLPLGPVVLIDICAPFSHLSILSHFTCFHLKFLSVLRLLSSSYQSLHISCLLFPLSLHQFKFLSLHLGIVTLSSQFILTCNYFRTVKKPQACTHSLFKHVRLKTGIRNNSSCDLFFQKAPYHTLLFSNYVLFCPRS